MFNAPDGDRAKPEVPLQCVQGSIAYAENMSVVDDIIALVRRRTGVDFSQYRRATVERRIGNRMISIGAVSLSAYLDRLHADWEEALRLLERLTIKVSRFYRNARTFDALADEVIPALAQARTGMPLRVWSAGCGNGEEAYTLAMLMDAAGVPGRVDATDIDPSALAAAMEGIYRVEACEELPSALMRAYLEPWPDGRYRVRDALRARVRFMPHDLTGNAPFPASTYDLVCCRNVLIYLDRGAQRRAFESLRAAMNEEAYLCLGEAEWPLPDFAEQLWPLGYKTQVFQCRGAATEMPA